MSVNVPVEAPTPEPGKRLINPASPRSVKVENIALFLFYATILGVLTSRHEMWRDELQAWLICQQSNGLSDLFVNTAYEGHPKLWFLILWTLSKVTSDPITVQIVNFIFSLGSAWLICTKSPFRLFEKALLLFGYFFLFEYGLIARNYQIASFLFLIIASCWKELPKSIWKIALCIALLAHTNAFALLAGFGLVIALLYRDFTKNRLFFLNLKTLLPYVLIGVSCLVFAYSVIPPADATYAAGWRFGSGIKKLEVTIRQVNLAFFPMPSLQQDFWGKSILFDKVSIRVVPLGMMLIALSIFRKRRDLLLAMAVGLLLTYFFSYAKFQALPRHRGNLFLLFIVCAWIYFEAKPLVSVRDKGVFWLILTFHFAAGVFAGVRDYQYPFSAAKNMADYLEQHHVKHYTVGINYCLTPIAGYLHRPGYALNAQVEHSYVTWKKTEYTEDMIKLPDSLLCERFLAYQKIHPDAVLIMNHFPLGQKRSSNWGFHIQPERVETLTLSGGEYTQQCRKAFEQSIVEDENYYIIDLKRK